MRTAPIFLSRGAGEGDRAPQRAWWRGQAAAGRRRQPFSVSNMSCPLHHPLFPRLFAGVGGWSPSPASGRGRGVAAALACVALSACVSGLAQPDGGIATYDALRAAQKDCEAKGRVFHLKHNGDAQYLEDYACERKN